MKDMEMRTELYSGSLQRTYAFGNQNTCWRMLLKLILRNSRLMGLMSQKLGFRHEIFREFKKGGVLV
jgi:hypothetical protein